MRAIVVYESMYGNTHEVADVIGAGHAGSLDVSVVSVAEAAPSLIAGADLVVVGGPTHVHGMSRESTRKAAAEAAQKPESDLKLDPDASGPGLRDWFASLGHFAAKAAAFDTRTHGPAVFTGRASRGVAHQLRSHGFEVVTDPESFLVTKQDRLDEHETERAREWGAELASSVAPGRS